MSLGSTVTHAGKVYASSDIPALGHGLSELFATLSAVCSFWAEQLLQQE